VNIGASPTVVIIDTSILLDMFLTARSRHADAERLRETLKITGVRLRMPMHGLFEVAAMPSPRSRISAQSLHKTPRRRRLRS
jgi:predicted nucleic acid-binding protein